VTEAEWLACADPVEMLLGLHFAHDQPRKFALFAFACSHLIWERLDAPSRRWLLEAEQNEDEHRDSGDERMNFSRDLLRQEVGLFCLRELQRAPAPAGASELVREVFGNPFRPVIVAPAWRTTTVLTLAVIIDRERAFDRLPILADALQDAGCDNEDILNHCRAPGVHVRGCWVVDVVLGKE
jgi:hypothetical protein